MIVIAIQARMGSTRLPGKVLADVDGLPMLLRMYQRVCHSTLANKVVIATAREGDNRRIVDVARDNNIDVYAGSENDLVDRLYQTSCQFNATALVRVTADCPLIDPRVIDKIIQMHIDDPEVDYISNIHPPTYPDGLDTELITARGLKKLWDMTRGDAFSSEWWFHKILKRTDCFSRRNLEQPQDQSHIRLTVDYPEDLELIRKIFIHFKNQDIFFLEDMLDLFRTQNHLLDINKKYVENNSYKEAITAGLDSKRGKFNQSFTLLERAKQCIPGQSQTLSKGWNQFVCGESPLFIENAVGSKIYDVDGNEFIDFIFALGAVTLGYGCKEVEQAVIEQIGKGITFSLPHRLEVELAEMLQKVLPCAEMVRFGKNGTDVTTAAIKIARSYTNREKVIYCGYHGGSSEWFGITTPLNRGIPKVLRDYAFGFKYNDIESLVRLFKEHPGEIAAVIMEPVATIEPKQGFLQEVKRITHEHGAVLIFDEMITGFRISLGGAAEYYRVVPDLGTFGKGIGNGMPITVLAGKKEIMQECENVFFSMTFGGETASIASALATIRFMQKHDVIDHMWRQGKKLKEGYNRLAHQYTIEAHTQCIGLPVHTVFSFKDVNGNEDLLLKSLFIQETARKGVLFSGVNNVSYATSDQDIAQALAAIEHAFRVMQQALRTSTVYQHVKGVPIQEIFKRNDSGPVKSEALLTQSAGYPQVSFTPLTEKSETEK